MNYAFRMDVLDAFSHFQYLAYGVSIHNSRRTKNIHVPLPWQSMGFSPSAIALECRSSYMEKRGTIFPLARLGTIPKMAKRIRD
jgi:hypothetical protein